MKIIRVSHYQVSSVGHGGYHRTYQIQYDLEQIIGQYNIVCFDNPWSYYPVRPSGRLSRAILAIRKRLNSYKENPLKILAHTEFTGKLFSFPKLLIAYEKLVKKLDQPLLCLIEHPGFADLLPINLHYNIPTIICPQNFEAFDLTPSQPLDKRSMYTKMIDFANEFHILAQCSERLFISRSETALISGLGLPAQYYPYLPVGAIRERLEQIRQTRSKGQIEPGLFLMLGTAAHDSTRQSFEWFIQNAQEYGLPPRVKVIVAGLDTDKLLPSGISVSGLELKGWIEQQELDQILSRVEAILIPQQSGFGALTRLPELACAGIPAVVSRHATYALDPPPGLEIVDDNWQAWCAGMENIFESSPRSSISDYKAWETGQPKTLKIVIKKLTED